jgi:MFS family permease
MAALGFAFFSVAMTFGRLLGDSLTERFGSGLLVLLGCLLAGGGMSFVLLSPTGMLALAGFTLVGIGFSVIVPLVFSASGKIGGNSYANLTTITLFSYCAFLLGPPLIGMLADWLGLRLALALIVVLTLVAAAFSRLAFRNDACQNAALQSQGEPVAEPVGFCLQQGGEPKVSP